ncbi:MAG TPA: multicopper oxidase domain-containing protein [Candidatus Saccharimonadales bacterium]|nr:multicopper oxidase domain-containing protein [Candidatus Saccharimonadales bacterium]
MDRREFLKYGGIAAAQLGVARMLLSQAQPAMSGMSPSAVAQEGSKADFTLRIAPVTVELTPTRIISTIGYNGTSPGPVLRMKEGKSVTVDVINETDVPELVHWHGLFLPGEVDGVEEEKTPMVPPRGRIRYQFTPRPAGTRWYHTHVMAGSDLHRGAYTGQFGFLMVEGANNPGNYDQEVFLALREWEPFFSPEEADDDEDSSNAGPQPERPKTLDTNPSGLEVAYQMFSINDKALGSGEPIRVRPGQRVLMHLLNASASMNRRLALPGHRFQIVALDGNTVPSPQSVDVIDMGPGERVDAIVEMNQPGIWVLGTTTDDARMGGMGVIVEYANQHKQPQWTAPAKAVWDYTVFGRAGTQPAPDSTIDMIFQKIPSGAGLFNSWTVNGKEYPHDQEFVLKQGSRYRLVFRNRSEDAHPLHMHRHSFELVEINGKTTAGIIKDTVVVPGYGRVSVDMVADQPGLTLFHCHIQQHMDYGFKALFRYA